MRWPPSLSRILAAATRAFSVQRSAFPALFLRSFDTAISVCVASLAGMGKVRDYKDLVVWQRAIDLLTAITPLARRLPRDERSQMRRAASSIHANIAEGHSRPQRGEFLQFLGYAYASLKELESHLIAAEATGTVDREAIASPLALADEVSRMLVAMRNALEAKGER
jgi:four helix bundle protein